MITVYTHSMEIDGGEGACSSRVGFQVLTNAAIKQITKRHLATGTLILELHEEYKRMQEEGDNKDNAPGKNHVLMERLCFARAPWSILLQEVVLDDHASREASRHFRVKRC